MSGQNPKQWRFDEFGHIINFFEYGQETTTGWVVSHIRPISQGGKTDLSNLRPLWWLAAKRMPELFSETDSDVEIQGTESVGGPSIGHLRPQLKK